MTKIRSASRTVEKRWGDDEHCLPAPAGGERLLDPRLALGVQRGSRLVKKQHRGLLQEGAGERQALALPAREARASGPDGGIQSALQVSDEVSEARIAQGGPELGVLRRAVQAVGEIAAHGLIQEVALLRDQRHGPAQGSERDIAHLGPVDAQGARARIPEAQEQVEERRLPRPRGADEAAVSPGRMRQEKSWRAKRSSPE